jgi:hypothetical protein
MSDPVKPEPAVPASTTPAEPVVVSEGAPIEPAATERASTEVAEPVSPVTPAVVEPVVEPVVVTKKKRGVGAWSFVLGLVTGLVDIAFVVWVIVVLVGTIGDLTAGNLAAISTAIGAAGLVIIALFVFFGGFLTAGLAVLLGLVALVTGRGRVLGVFGLLFGVAALGLRIALLSAGFSPDLG